MSPKLFNTLLIISSIVLYFYVVKPLYTGVASGLWVPEQSVQSLLDSKKQYDATIVGVDAIIRQGKTTLTQYNTFDDATKNTMMIMVPTSIDEVKLLSELTKIANDSGFAIEDLSVKDKTGEYTVTFVIKTTYPNFKRFIANYEKSMRLLTLKSASFIPSKDERDIIKFNVELTTYYMK